MNSDLYKFKSAVCIRFRKAVAYFDGDPEVNVTKEIGKFIKKKQWNTAIGYYEKSNAKSMDIDMERICFCFNRIRRQKSLKSSKKAMDMVDVFLQPQFIIIPV
jgi:hypothetical protein